MRYAKIGFILLILVVGIGFAIYGNQADKSEKFSNISAVAKTQYPIEIPSEANLTQAQNLYNHECASCHGENGEGQMPDPYAVGSAPPHDSTGHTWHHPDQSNLNTVLNGGATMPAFGDKLSQDEVILILGYIKTWWGENELTVQRQRTEAFTEVPE